MFKPCEAAYLRAFKAFNSSVFSQCQFRTLAVDFSLGNEEMPEVKFGLAGVQKLIANISPRKANGPDDIAAAIISNCSESLCLYFCRLFQKCLDMGAVPANWKLANVVPVYKSGPKNCVENYRPVSLTSITCKVMEHVIYSCIMSHLVKHNLLNINQHGFRQGFSCSTQLVEFTHDLVLAIDKRQIIDCIFLGF